MENFLRDLREGDIQLRDRWQFELKSEFTPTSSLPVNHYSLEFYLFIPSALQINKHTFPSKEFYINQTNFIRYKTPRFFLEELISDSDERSPLSRLFRLLQAKVLISSSDFVKDELKLLANVVRSTLRRHVRSIVDNGQSDNLDEKLQHLAVLINKLLTRFRTLKGAALEKEIDDSLNMTLHYVDEFISSSVDFYVKGLIEIMESRKWKGKAGREILFDLLLDERSYREKRFVSPHRPSKQQEEEEYILYRRGLLGKFIQDVLFLKANRVNLEKPATQVMSMIAAAFATFTYLLLFVWGGEVLVINSLPFILLCVVFYVLKDRMKEWIRIVGVDLLFNYLSDYSTKIYNPQDGKCIGKLSETLQYFKPGDLPDTINSVRNKEFHSELESFRRPESVISYRQDLELFSSVAAQGYRRRELNTIFRFNILPFIEKAGNPERSYIGVDPETRTLVRRTLPKVYHINIIIRNRYLSRDLQKKTELRKFRLVVDKNGIKRVEQVEFSPRLTID